MNVVSKFKPAKKNKVQRLIVVSLFSVLIQGLILDSLFAGNLNPPQNLEYTSMLPKGVRNPRFKNMFLSMDKKFDLGGKEIPLANALNKEVRWTDITQKLEHTDGTVSAKQFRGLVQALDAGTGPGEAVANLNISANVMLPVLGIGITDRFTLALAAPIYDVEIQAKTGFIANENGVKLLKALEATNPVKAAKLRDSLNNPINGKITDPVYGYKPIQNESFNKIGDMRLVGKLELLNQEYASKKNVVTVRPMVTIPTGYEQDPDRLVDVPTGDGQFDVAAQFAWDHFASDWLRFNTYATYTAQLPDETVMRIPTQGDSPLAPASDKELVKRDLGDQMELATSINFGSLQKGLSLGVGYSYQFQKQSGFSGNKFSAERYKFLENNYRLQELQTATIMAGFATIEAYKDKEFPLPFQFFITYSQPVSGRNVISNNLIAAEFVGFF